MGNKIWTAVIGFFGLLIVFGLGFLVFVLSAIVTGQTSYEYRCASHAVVEKRAVYWGFGFGSYQPINGEDNATCIGGQA